MLQFRGRLVIRDTRDGTPSSKGDVFFQKKYCIIEKYILSLQAE